MDRERQLIERYFWSGFQYPVIVQFLSEYHGIHLSVRTLRRRLHDYGLRRYGGVSSLLDVWNAVHSELQGAGSLGGYRFMTAALRRKYHLHVSQETVRLILQQVDPVGVASRRCHRLTRRTYVSRGPNHIWHIDGYDKLRSYGFLISGCIDGYSRRIIWLKCASSNHDPGVIAHYYKQSIDSAGGCPDIIRSDCGTENLVVAAMQHLLRDDDSSHTFGTSPSNQRIEAWWSFLRRGRTQWWMELFSSVVDQDLFHVGHVRETDCLRFCFMNILRHDLDDVVAQWNTHRIRPSRGARCPPGVPDILYYFPDPPAVDCLHRNLRPFSDEILQRVTVPTVCDDQQFGEYLMYLCNFHGWAAPSSVDDATVLYNQLQRLL